jgi:two-component system NtrC family response regulator
LPSETLLIVDDEESILRQLTWAFKEDFKIATAQTPEEAFEAIKSKKPCLMILDLALTGDPEDLEGFRVLEEALIIKPLLKVIVITGHDERENALKAIEKGAYDFFTKPIVVDELRVTLTRAAYLFSLEDELNKLRKKVSRKHEFEGIIAMSAPMLDIFNTAKKVAPTDVSVLITGENGTGKELMAKAIHNISARSEMPFVPINCAAIPENLLESELFGHEKGSFTGAHASRPGKFEIADRGTIFLDEIGYLAPKLQVKILRFLQDQVIERVGGREPIQLNVRIIAATNRDLETMLKENAFREDLYYRINTIRINIPPLRERGDDIMLLAMNFLHHYNIDLKKNIRGFSQPAQKLIHLYSWPGNIRELENLVKRAVIMATERLIQPEDLDIPDWAKLLEGQTTEMPGGVSLEEVQAFGGKTLREAREEAERRAIINALLRTNGNVSAAAEELDISRPTLHDLMKKHGIDPADYRTPKGNK